MSFFARASCVSKYSYEYCPITVGERLEKFNIVPMSPLQIAAPVSRHLPFLRWIGGGFLNGSGDGPST
jgi:hypothetical protein